MEVAGGGARGGAGGLPSGAKQHNFFQNHRVLNPTPVGDGREGGAVGVLSGPKLLPSGAKQRSFFQNRVQAVPSGVAAGGCRGGMHWDYKNKVTM